MGGDVDSRREFQKSAPGKVGSIVFNGDPRGDELRSAVSVYARKRKCKEGHVPEKGLNMEGLEKDPLRPAASETRRSAQT